MLRRGLPAVLLLALFIEPSAAQSGSGSASLSVRVQVVRLCDVDVSAADVSETVVAPCAGAAKPRTEVTEAAPISEAPRPVTTTSSARSDRTTTSSRAAADPRPRYRVLTINF